MSQIFNGLDRSRLVLRLAAGAAAVAVLSGGVASASVPPSDAPVGGSSVPGGVVDLAAARAQVDGYIEQAAATTYVDEDTLKIGPCPLVTADDVTRLTKLLGADYPFELAPAEWEIDEEVDEGQTISALGLYCDIDPDDDDVTTVDGGLVSVVDRNNPRVVSGLDGLLPALGDPTPGPADIGGEIYAACRADDDEQECYGVWLGDELAVAVNFELAVVDGADTAFIDATPEFARTVLANLAAA